MKTPPPTEEFYRVKPVTMIVDCASFLLVDDNALELPAA